HPQNHSVGCQDLVLEADHPHRRPTDPCAIRGPLFWCSVCDHRQTPRDRSSQETRPDGNASCMPRRLRQIRPANKYWKRFLICLDLTPVLSYKWFEVPRDIPGGAAKRAQHNRVARLWCALPPRRYMKSFRAFLLLGGALALLGTPPQSGAWQP